MIRWPCILLLPVAVARSQTPAASMRLACDAAGVPPTTSAATLTQRFGQANVVDAVIELGEGFTRSGTVLFPTDSARRVEILWQDSTSRRFPESVKVSGKAVRWTTPSGLALGTTLRTVERLNGKAFQMAGFAFDESGAITSWLGGRLQSKPSDTCELRGGFDPIVRDSSDRRWYDQVLGDSNFSSGNPAMQALNPRIDRLVLVYRDMHQVPLRQP